MKEHPEDLYVVPSFRRDCDNSSPHSLLPSMQSRRKTKEMNATIMILQLIYTVSRTNFHCHRAPFFLLLLQFRSHHQCSQFFQQLDDRMVLAVHLFGPPQSRFSIRRRFVDIGSVLDQ
jgi:hypothetical protein